MSEVIDTYFQALKAVHEYFGYADDWRIFPIVDEQVYYWALVEDSRVVRSASPENLRRYLHDEDCDESDIYESEIYTSPHLSKYIYRTEAHTMILCDTQCDGNIWLAIYENAKEVGG